MSARPQAKLVKMHSPEASKTAVASWKALTRPALPSVTSGSVLNGMPSTSEATV